MAESPIKITRNDDGLFVRCEFDARYISDEDAKHIRGYIDQLKAENTKLLEQMERLVTLLRVDCDIDASWDGLRRFWSIGLTEGGCLMRDRACKAEAENAELREQGARLFDKTLEMGTENAKLRELVQKMMRFMEDGDWCTTCEVAKECDAQECEEQEQYEEDCLMRGVFHDRMRELGVEVDA